MNIAAGTGGVYTAIGGTSVTQLYAGGLRPVADNSKNLGTASQRWAQVYAGNPTINTSDARSKTDIRSVDAAEKVVAQRLKGLIRAFRWRDAVDEKGDGARIHFGVIAQEVVSAFQAEGLDPFAYGVVCHDSWAAQDKRCDDAGQVISPAIAAGDRFGIRYEELMAFILAGL